MLRLSSQGRRKLSEMKSKPGVDEFHRRLEEFGKRLEAAEDIATLGEVQKGIVREIETIFTDITSSVRHLAEGVVLDLTATRAAQIRAALGE